MLSPEKPFAYLVVLIVQFILKFPAWMKALFLKMDKNFISQIINLVACNMNLISGSLGDPKNPEWP